MSAFEKFEAQVARHGLTARQYQRNLVDMGTNGLTESEREAITDLCIDARKRGDANVSVWHHAAAYFGTACQCAMCVAAANAA